MLAEGVAETLSPAVLRGLAAEVDPKPPFDDEQMRAALPPRGRFTIADLRLPVGA